MASRSMSSQPEVVTSSDRCAVIVRELLGTETVVGVDAEGVNLGKTGPLTLVQVATRAGRVFLFDVHTNKSLLGRGYLKDLLESDDVVKIIHSCRRDSAALTAQFNVVLRNVFDTQVAHLELEEDNGKLLPLEIKLADICEMYGADASLLSSKDDIKKAWTLTAGYWAIRPMKPEMIEYAAADVHVLFKLYDNLSKLLREKGLWEKFQRSVNVEIVVEIDPEVRKRKYEQFGQTVERILKEIARKCDLGEVSHLEDLDGDEDRAMDLCTTDQIIKTSAKFKELRMQRFRQFLEETEHKISEDPHTFVVTRSLYGKLKSNESLYETTALGRKIKDLLKKLNTLQLEGIKRKYTADTPLEYIHDSDLGVIRAIRIEEESNPILKALYNRVTLSEFRELKEKHRDNPRSVSVPKYVYLKIRFLATKSRLCSRELKTISKELWQSFVQQYGKDHNYNTPRDR